MLINHTQLTPPPFTKKTPMMVVIGQDLWLVNQLAQAIKQGIEIAHLESFKKTSLVEKTEPFENIEPLEKSVVIIESHHDWQNLTLELNHYSLFSYPRLIDVFYEKKTLDIAAKTFLDIYLNNQISTNQITTGQITNANPFDDCVVLIRAPQLPLSQLKPWLNHAAMTVIQAVYPNQTTIKNWLKNQLMNCCAGYDKEIPDMIYQFNQGNLTACSQLLTKLSLLIEPTDYLHLDTLMQYLDDQSIYPLFSLSQACLTGDSQTLIAILRQARSNKTEPLLVLWIITQEVRLLLQLLHLIKNANNFQNAQNTSQLNTIIRTIITKAAPALKILSIKIPWYTAALTNYQTSTESLLLTQLLTQCHRLDYQFKTKSITGISWQILEQLALSLCLRKKVGLND